jgi:ribose/xylose/arabinose/galactoside ABC-type transport system permease subunit
MLVVGTSIGVINGLIVRKFNIYPLITTLGILFAGRGLGQYLIQGGVKVLPKEIIFFGNGKIFGIPIPIIIAVFFLIVGQFVLTKTSFGRQVVAIGDNEQAASKSGIMVGKIKMIVYIISGFSAAISGLVLSAQVSSVYPNTAKDLEFTVLVSLVVGGVSLFGAKGSVFPGAFIGVMFLTTIFNGLVIANASPYLFPVIKGVVIFLAILVDTIKMRKNVISIYKFSEVKD